MSTLFGISSLRNTAHAATYCPGQQFNPYSYICAVTGTYKRGQSVTFTLNQSRIPLFIGPLEHPWRIVDSHGTTIFTPSSTPPTTQPSYAFSWSDTWNGRDDKGKKVKPGTYYIVMPPMPYSIANFPLTIVKKHA